MKSPYKVSFISNRDGNAFSDYYLQINDIFVCTENTILLTEALNASNTKFSEGAFSLLGDGFNGYKVSLRMPKQITTLKDNDVIDHIANTLANVLEKIKTTQS